MPANDNGRKANTAMQTGVNQVAFATPIVSLLGYWLTRRGLPPDLIAPTAALAMAAITTAGTVLRNVAAERGWTKYIG